MKLDEYFQEAASDWDLVTLYTDLASVKGKSLTPVEKLHLRGLLCGYSPSEIAEKLHKNLKGVETNLCATVYKYVKGLLDKSNEKMDNWRNIAQWLEEAGYKCKSSHQVPLNSLIPGHSVVNITNISIEKNQLVIVLNLKIPTFDALNIPVSSTDTDHEVL